MPSKKHHPHMQSVEDANRFGFDWPGSDGTVPSAHVQVTRVSSIERSNGAYKVITIAAEHGDELHVYIAPRGKMRIFRQGVELKEVAK
jgi:hypothetical protein